jgi:hypothetical protein
MKLIILHKILIAFAITFFLFFGFREIIRDGGNSVVGGLVIAVAAGSCYYFVWLLRGGYDKR